MVKDDIKADWHSGAINRRGEAGRKMNGSKKMRELTDNLVTWTKLKVNQAGAKGVIVGLSGGIDSVVTGVLCKRAFPQNILGLNLPCNSNPVDKEHALLLGKKFDIPLKVVVLDKAFDLLRDLLTAGDATDNFEKTEDADREAVAIANIKPRLRMIALYYHANRLGYLVAGSGNKSELSVGYYTKYGDGGVDFLPLGNLAKTGVRELAVHLGIPKEIIVKTPSAGLWESQTDEGEMGFTYKELDEYLLAGSAEPNISKKIKQMIEGSEHKRKMPPIPPF